MSVAPSSPARRVAIIGFGAIGRSVAGILTADPGWEVAVMRRRDDAEDGITVLPDLAALLDWSPDIVVEAASADALTRYAPDCMAAGIDVVAASVGALASADLVERLLDVGAAQSSHLIVPAGAVGGIDHVAAAALHPETRVTYISRKPPAAWTDELAAADLTEAARAGEVSLFEGDARDAARRYPRNLNAGLTIALAAGFDRTLVRVVADPDVSQNTHEIRVTGPLGDSFMSFRNTPAPENPKTSAITAYSIAATVKRRFGVVR